MIESWDLFVTLLPRYAAQIGMAVLCGLLLGIERERKDKPAGLRTIMLITVGATLYMLVSNVIVFVQDGPENITQVDPSRIAAQVVSGIGFLGAGTIIQARGAIHGLTTAATIWVAAGIGLCIGVGFPLFGLGITFVVLLVLVALDPLSRWLSRRGEKRQIELLGADDSLVLERLEGVFNKHDLFINHEPLVRHDENTVRLVVHFVDSGTATNRFFEALARIEGVQGTHVPLEAESTAS